MGLGLLCGALVNDQLPLRIGAPCQVTVSCWGTSRKLVSAHLLLRGQPALLRFLHLIQEAHDALQLGL